MAKTITIDARAARDLGFCVAAGVKKIAATAENLHDRMRVACTDAQIVGCGTLLRRHFGWTVTRRFSWADASHDRVSLGRAGRGARFM